MAGNKTILIFGDSLSAAYGLTPGTGWTTLLEQRLAQGTFSYRVVNASVSGETTAGGATRIASLLRAHQPSFILIELGGNDGLRGLPIELMRKNLDTIIKAAKRSGARPLLIGMRLPPNYGMSYTTKFQLMYRELATRHDIVLVPFMLQRIAARADYFQADMVHPTAAAQNLILEEIWDYLEPLLEEQRKRGKG